MAGEPETIIPEIMQNEAYQRPDEKPRVVIVAACRTPIGNLKGTLASLPAHKLGTIVIAEALKRANVKPEDVEDVILGQVSFTMCGMAWLIDWLMNGRMDGLFIDWLIDWLVHTSVWSVVITLLCLFPAILTILNNKSYFSLKFKEVFHVLNTFSLQVLTGGQGQNPARQAAVAAGLPVTVPASSVQMVCGSGMRALANAYQSITSGDARIVVAGGQESMSQAPHVVTLRNTVVMGDVAMKDTCTTDGLTDAFNGTLMGVTGENVASQWKISRQEQDEYAAESQRRAGIAAAEGFFAKEIVPLALQSRKGGTGQSFRETFLIYGIFLSF